MHVYPFVPPQLPSGDTTPAPEGIGMIPVPEILGDITARLLMDMLLDITDEYAGLDMLELPQMPY
jgi:hypothetical protein